jgi:hypothetical protein
MYIGREDDEIRLETELACACDLLNTWARELGVEECADPYRGFGLRNLIDRIWLKTSIRHLGDK